MDVLFFCPRWGSESLPPAQFIQRVLDAGFDGVEVGLADEDPGAEQVLAEAKAAGLRVIAQEGDGPLMTMPIGGLKTLSCFGAACE